MRNMLKVSTIGLALLVGCEPQIEPVLTLPQKISEMKQAAREYSNSLYSSEVIISNAVNSRYFSANNQRESLRFLKDAKVNYDRFNKLSSSCPEHIDSLVFPNEKLTQLQLLTKNVEGFDGSTPEIQKYFCQRYPNFRADAIESTGEQAAEAAAEISAQILSIMLSGD